MTFAAFGHVRVWSSGQFYAYDISGQVAGGSMCAVRQIDLLI